MQVSLVTRFFRINGVNYSRTQYPLTDAFARTVHKTQGLGFDDITVALDSSIFSAGQAYTALSRAKTKTGISITHLEKCAFIVDKEAVEECQRLEEIWKRHESSIIRRRV